MKIRHTVEHRVINTSFGVFVLSVIVGGIVLAGAITMLLIIPHPWWFTIAAPLSIIVAAVLATYLAPGLRPSAGAAK